MRNSVPVGPVRGPGGRFFKIHDAVSADLAKGERLQGGLQSVCELLRLRSRCLSLPHLLGLSSLKQVSFGKDCFRCGHLLEFRSGRVRRRRAVDLVALERISFPEEAFPSVTILIFQSRAAGEVLSRSPETAECSNASFCVRQYENFRGQRRQF